MTNQQVDILIIGGGLTGASLMLALRGLGFSCLLIERKSFEDKINPDFDARSLALSPASVDILSMLGVWELLHKEATPIHLIHVSDQHRFGSSRLHAEPNKPLGYVVEMQYINRALHQLLDNKQVLTPATLIHLDPVTHEARFQTPTGEHTVKAGLIVAADGTDSTVRSLCKLSASIKKYQQQAIVANIGLTKKHMHQAFERFTKEGPIAMLPMQGERMSLVWACSPQQAKKLLAVNEQEFLAQLQQAFGYRLGRFVKVGTRFSYPLQQLLMQQQVKWPLVFVGNAAHTLHPVAGQGFNLGLRDVATLAQCIVEYGLNKKMLDQYYKLRQSDQRAIINFTNGLIKLFTSRIPGVGLARDLGLILLDNSNFLKQCLSRYAQGYSGVIPDLVCQIALDKRDKYESTI
ncbi:2-octaprenyl-6-methoxyphenyl hydroxylase [Legionella sp. km772]|uniref:2-octaprenyl-6-methoxyphenyl hydroxylase n=1 Tax=Legionella sp. km772 TaxID=2498111 RepID=UPI000F8C8C22|nr:2-octaprenyl-6-methoxyphenyl hydroxylase [Legionella sp. km772]RUR13517.1 2-octaprenyl-6-methoxyphenyl hydroxylase [Legionella sp. km772]